MTKTSPYQAIAPKGDALSTAFEQAETFEDVVAVVQAVANGIMLDKRARRGTENISEQGIPGVITRMSSDKAARLRRLGRDIGLWGMLTDPGIQRVTQPSPADVEDLVDDLLDTINYATIALALLYGVWELPQTTFKETTK